MDYLSISRYLWHETGHTDKLWHETGHTDKLWHDTGHTDKQFKINQPEENYQPAARHWQTWIHNVISSTPHHDWD
jgi:hypothetical protein